MEGGIFITGAVSNPGYYPLTGNDSIEALLRDAGGATGEADYTDLRLFIPVQGQEPLPQRININRAETWLLEALPGIGPARAQAIVDYRQNGGLFRSTDEITRIEDIGAGTYERIKSLITVSE
ncbi:MAG TPA: ComEA family DNA-binding protein [Dehalococcoidia bacterium]|nr:ComEA family DNA-binding protein [Dehalococcoidia bacterium]